MQSRLIARFRLPPQGSSITGSTVASTAPYRSCPGESVAEARGKITFIATLAAVVPGAMSDGVNVAELLAGAPCTLRRMGPVIACPAAFTERTKLAVPPGCVVWALSPAEVMEKSEDTGVAEPLPIVTLVGADRDDRKFMSPE